MKVQEITDPAVLGNFVVQELLERAFPADSLAVKGGFSGAPEAFVEIIEDAHAALFLGAEDGLLKGAALLHVPPAGSTLSRPQIVHFYNEGSASLRRALASACVEKTRENGHIKLWAINATGRPDSVWSRMFRSFGPSEKVGAIMEVTLA